MDKKEKIALMRKADIKNLSKGELEERLKSMGQAPYRALQIWRWLYGTSARSFEEMTDLPSGLRAGLKEHFHISHPAILDMKRSAMDGTAKYLLRLEDASTIETVFIPEKKRNTVCLSSQVGCKYACSFCASAPFGFVRNLTPSEILNQAIAAKDNNPSSCVTNLVFMGIGEPLDNYDNVLAAVRVFNDKDAFNIGARRITISTCGLIPQIKRLAEEKIQIELSVSLHSANEAIRSKLVPINKVYPVKELMKACRDYIKSTNRVITFEYILIKGINSSRKDAYELAKALKPMKCKVNTISYNNIAAKDYGVPSMEDVRSFVKALREKGINALHRKSKGEDIDAACGQLRIARL